MLFFMSVLFCFIARRRDLVQKLVPELLYRIQSPSDAMLREDAVFIIGEWAWMYVLS